MGKKIKQHKTVVSREAINNFAPIYLKFNFSYITYDEDLNEEHVWALFKRMRDLSSEPYITIMQRRKDIGFEIEDLDIKKDIPVKFTERFLADIGKLAVFRIYPNNNPIVARVIGKIINKIMYVFYIDIGGKLYEH